MGGLAACTAPTTTAAHATSSSSNGASAAVAGSGSITVGLNGAPDALDPTTASTFDGRTVFANMCQKLYDINAQLNIVPQLATALPAISADGKSYTIQLRQGIKFNDGTPFNAAVVRYLCDRIAVMSRGEIVEAGPRDQVFLSPSHPYTRDLLAATEISRG